MQIIVMVLYVILSVSGVVFFKLGSTKSLSVLVTSDFLSLKISWLSIVGLCFYVASFMIYMGLIAKNNLSYLVPIMTGAVYILTLVSAVVVFKDKLSIYEIVGSSLILMGLIFINLKRG